MTLNNKLLVWFKLLKFQALMLKRITYLKVQKFFFGNEGKRSHWIIGIKKQKFNYDIYGKNNSNSNSNNKIENITRNSNNNNERLLLEMNGNHSM